MIAIGGGGSAGALSRLTSDAARGTIGAGADAGGGGVITCVDDWLTGGGMLIGREVRAGIGAACGAVFDAACGAVVGAVFAPLGAGGYGAAGAALAALAALATPAAPVDDPTMVGSAS